MRLQFFSNIKQPGAFGGLQPFVGTGRVEIDPHFLKIDIHHSNRLSAVDCDILDAFFPGPR